MSPSLTISTYSSDSELGMTPSKKIQAIRTSDWPTGIVVSVGRGVGVLISVGVADGSGVGVGSMVGVGVGVYVGVNVTVGIVVAVGG